MTDRAVTTPGTAPGTESASSSAVATEPAATITFEPPGPGEWMLDTTHHGRRPITAFCQPMYREGIQVGMARLFERYGLPLAGARLEFVHGCGYLRIMGIGEPEEPKGPPPDIVLRIVARIHPALRRRNRRAAEVLRDRAWRADVDQWFEHDRDRVIARNIELQSVDLGALDDTGLLAHLDDGVAHARECAVNSFVYHGGDIVPIGLYLAACGGWGISVGEASSLLEGFSPATTANDRRLAPVADAIARAWPELAGSAGAPTTVDDVRSLGPDVARVIDEWLAIQGWRVLTSDDIDAPTLAESPELQLAALLAVRGSRSDRADRPPPDPAPIRDRVPTDERGRFDELLAEARYGMRLRDDHVGIRWNWPIGLLRRALLEVGRRLVDRGAAHRAEHAVELRHEEVADALAGRAPAISERVGRVGATPLGERAVGDAATSASERAVGDGATPDAAVLDGTSASGWADELAARRAWRDAVEMAGPPLRFGPPSDPPPLHLFPKPLATVAAGAMALIDAMEPSGERPPMVGAGIGTSLVRGRACLVRSAVDAFDRLESGDVLVAPFTSSSYDSLFPLVGAVVTDEGGPMSHAAIMAREFGITAVIGAAAATTTVPDGALVEVDPGSGRVRVLT